MKARTLRPRAAEPFSEKSFYLEEFHGRTLGFAGAPEALRDPAPLAAVLDELAKNDTRSVVIGADAAALRRLAGAAPVPASQPRLAAAVWRSFARGHVAGVLVGDGALAPASCEVALELGLSKLVLLEPEGGLQRPDGSRDSFVELDELRALVRAGAPGQGEARFALLAEIERALDGGLVAVNLCTPEGVADELFTYAGSGTLFSRQRYVDVRPLGIDDYDAVNDLIARGIAEGFLAPRPPEEVEEVLVRGFGAFVEGVHLAGIGALLHQGCEGSEIASLYTLTRYIGGGIGGHLIRYAVERASAAGRRYVFACTTSERVVAFFEGHGFREVGADELPIEKWEGYDPARRERLRCLRRELPG